jgi:hypothetical protein
VTMWQSFTDHTARDAFFALHYPHVAELAPGWARDSVAKPRPLGDSKFRRAGGGAKTALSGAQEQQLDSWMSEVRNAFHFLTIHDVMAKAAELFPEVDCEFSYHWFHGFAERHGWRVYHVFNKIKTSGEEGSLGARAVVLLRAEKLRLFFHCLLKLLDRPEWRSHPELCVLIDTLGLLYQSTGGAGCLNKKSSNHVFVRTAGRALAGFSMLLAFTAAGRKLPPLFIFKATPHSFSVCAALTAGARARGTNAQVPADCCSGACACPLWLSCLLFLLQVSFPQARSSGVLLVSGAAALAVYEREAVCCHLGRGARTVHSVRPLHLHVARHRASDRAGRTDRLCTSR